ncbi:MAG: hypothetical protein FWH55_11990 [Oscillospiraceae bacterium]|nr:hypothetical protein [Oscillospiraceae bacterium]
MKKCTNFGAAFTVIVSVLVALGDTPLFAVTVPAMIAPEQLAEACNPCI